jgi:putative MFS transporter
MTSRSDSGSTRAARVLADRSHLWAFVAGSLAVTVGVLLHLPMFWMGRHNGFRLADMPMDAEMTWGWS